MIKKILTIILVTSIVNIYAQDSRSAKARAKYHVSPKELKHASITEIDKQKAKRKAVLTKLTATQSKYEPSLRHLEKKQSEMKAKIKKHNSNKNKF